MNVLRLILGDQLSHKISSLQDVNKKSDIIMMCEVWQEATYVGHHKKKIAFIFSAMRHFAEELKKKSYKVHYVKLDTVNKSSSFESEVAKAVKKLKIDQVIVTEASEYRVLKNIETWAKKIKRPVEIREDNRFFCSKNEFKKWSAGRSSLTMEFFYRHLRKKHKILMDDESPIGGLWNYDKDNRKPAKETIKPPEPYKNKVDSITQEVLNLVKENFPNHFGDLEPFHFAVTRQQALAALKLFLNKRLSLFGDYQDVMLEGEPWMYHSHISFYLNCGLLNAEECVLKAIAFYHEGKAPINAVEGFVRQILGWREYVRGIYWLKMPSYVEENFFTAKKPLPDFYWTAKTKMNCLSQCVKETQQNAYAHHIQRLMILGNFALLAGIDPKFVNEWFLVVYADAYEWVELPNVSGMILFADGGYLASKPYAAGGSYINKMSNYCKKCSYQVKEKNGVKACPFNYLYWDFLSRNRDKLIKNHRIGMMYKIFDRMDEKKKNAIAGRSQGRSNKKPVPEPTILLLILVHY